jgi:hypothetical protein
MKRVVNMKNSLENRKKIESFTKNELTDVFSSVLKTENRTLDVAYEVKGLDTFLYPIEPVKMSGELYCLEFFIDETQEGIRYRSVLDLINLLVEDIDRIFEVNNKKTIEENFVGIIKEIKKYKLSKFYE